MRVMVVLPTGYETEMLVSRDGSNKERQDVFGINKGVLGILDDVQCASTHTRYR